MALTLNGGNLILGNNITLIVRGSVSATATTITLTAGSVLQMDASLATTPLSQRYAIFNTAFTAANALTFIANGTNASPAIIKSNTAGGNAYFYFDNGHSDGIFFKTFCVTVTNPVTDICVQFKSIGNANQDALLLNPSASATPQIFENTSWDSLSGRVVFTTAVPLIGGWDIEYSRFNQLTSMLVDAGQNNSYEPLVLKVTNGVTTGKHLLLGNSFPNQPPLLIGCTTCDYVNNYFGNEWVNATSSTKWRTFSGNMNVNRNGTDSPQQNYGFGTGLGQLRNSFYMWYVPAAASFTGTVTSATATTMTDTNAAFGTTTYCKVATVGTGCFVLEFTSGTCLGIRRPLSNSSANVLTSPTNPTTAQGCVPSVGDSYAVYGDEFNNHGYEFTSGTGDQNVIGNVFQDAGCDSQGDAILHMDQATQYTIAYNIGLPNGCADSSGTLFTQFTNANANSTITAVHNTSYGGAQSAAACESNSGTCPVKTIIAFQSNLIWSIPGATYWAHGGNVGPYVLADAFQVITDPVAINCFGGSSSCADYNGSYGNLTNGTGTPGRYDYIHTVNPGTHDVVGTNPFTITPGPAACAFWTWAVAQGSANTQRKLQIDDGLAYINANPVLVTSSLLPYIQSCSRPASAYNGTAADGTTIGAVPFSAAGTSISGASISGAKIQ